MSTWTPHIPILYWTLDCILYCTLYCTLHCTLHFYLLNCTSNTDVRVAGWTNLFLRNIPSLTFCKLYITLYCTMYWTFYYILYCIMYCTQNISLYCIHHFSLRSRQMPMNETSKPPHQASRLQYSTVYSTVQYTVQYSVQ